MTKEQLRKQIMVSMRIMDVFIANCGKNISDANIVSFRNGLFKFATHYWGGAISSGVRIYFTHEKRNSTYLSSCGKQELEELLVSAMKEPFAETEVSYSISIAEKVINELNKYLSTGSCSYSSNSAFFECMNAANTECYNLLNDLTSQIANTVIHGNENDYLQDTIDFLHTSVQCGVLYCYATDPHF